MQVGLVGAEKRISGEFLSQSRRHCGFNQFTFAFDVGLPSAQSKVVGINRDGKADIALRIFMGAVDSGSLRQCPQPTQAGPHLVHGAFKDTSTPDRKQGVAAE